MGVEVEDSGAGGADTGGEEHVAELADGGVGEDAFYVGLGQGDAGGEEGGEGADDGDAAHGEGR